MERGRHSRLGQVPGPRLSLSSTVGRRLDSRIGVQTVAEASGKDRDLRRKDASNANSRVADDLESFRFNTAVAGLMEWVNTAYESRQRLCLPKNALCCFR